MAKAKKLITTGEYMFVPRSKNMHSLADHGMTVADAKNEIISLVTGDYYKGPKEDLDPKQPGDVWEFKKKVNGEQFYVKLKIQNINGREILKCLSFHDDEFD